MSGILNSKERIFDLIITEEGKRQLADNSYEIKFAAFADGNVFYQSDEISGSADATSRIYLEASNLPQDQITFEADDSGKLFPFGGSNLEIFGGKIMSASAGKYLQFITSSVDFASLGDVMLSSSFENFKKLSTIGTLDFLDETNNFILSDDKLKFSITSNAPIEQDDVNEISVNNLTKFFQDPRLSRIPNFQYLPPKNKRKFRETETRNLGNYPKLGQGKFTSFEEIEARLINKENNLVEFIETSNQNNVHIQVFENTSNELLKLDILDFGEMFIDGDDFPSKHIYFIGKVFLDEAQNRNFVNLFTVVME